MGDLDLVHHPVRSAVRDSLSNWAEDLGVGIRRHVHACSHEQLEEWTQLSLSDDVLLVERNEREEPRLECLSGCGPDAVGRVGTMDPS